MSKLQKKTNHNWIEIFNASEKTPPENMHFGGCLMTFAQLWWFFAIYSPNFDISPGSKVLRRDVLVHNLSRFYVQLLANDSSMKRTTSIFCQEPFIVRVVQGCSKGRTPRSCVLELRWSGLAQCSWWRCVVLPSNQSKVLDDPGDALDEEMTGALFRCCFILERTAYYLLGMLLCFDT